MMTGICRRWGSSCPSSPWTHSWPRLSSPPASSTAWRRWSAWLPCSQHPPASCPCPRTWRRPWRCAGGRCCTPTGTTSPSSTSSMPSSSTRGTRAGAGSRGLCAEALRLAGTVRSELLEAMRRIELPVSPPAFGSDANALNIQRALISGYFLKVARDIDGSGNYVMLTHKHVAHLAPACGYLLRAPPRRLPPWVLYHEFTISQDNCLQVVSEIQPQMLVELAPQYYLSNLPPSEGRDLLMELREKVVAAAEEAAPAEAELAEGAGREEDEPGDVCVLQ
uniref:Uncharacterized protein n=1 Tax=Geospiza parvula TaxID=87175 RepID=A0A8C3M5W2_GEOPR